MKKLLVYIVALLLILTGLLYALVTFLPTNVIKDQIEQQVLAQTGRQLTIQGEIGIRLFPQLSVSFSQVQFANWPQQPDPPMVSLEKLEAQLAVMPLFRGEVQIEGFILDTPRIRLEKDSEGRANWDMPLIGAATTEPAEEPVSEPSRGTSAFALKDISIRDVRLVNGSLIYRDLASQTTQELSDINLSLFMSSLDSPFAMEGRVTFNQQAFSMKILGQGLRNLLQEQPLPVDLELSSELVNVGLEGEFVPATTSARADLRLDIPSLRNLMNWLETPLEGPETIYNRISLVGTGKVSPDQLAFENLQLIFDSLQAQGMLAADLRGERPLLRGELSFNDLDLEPYLGEETAETAEPSGDADSTQQTSADWPDQPIEISALQAVDVDLQLSTASLKAAGLQIGAAELTVLLSNGSLQVELPSLDLYQGTGQASFSLDSGNNNALKARANLEAIAIEPLLTDVAEFSKLSGRGAVSFDVSGSLTSVKGLIAGLNGKGALALSDGAVKGVDLAGLVRSLLGGDEERLQTDFAELSGSYIIVNGVLKNDDLKLLNPLVRLGGQGEADLLRRTVNYLVTPRAVASLEGQGAVGDESGIMIPVRIKGPWDKLSFKPELDDATKARVEAEKEKVKQELEEKLDKEKGRLDEKIQEELKDDKVQKKLDKYLGEKEQEKLKGKLEKLFGN